MAKPIDNQQLAQFLEKYRANRKYGSRSYDAYLRAYGKDAAAQLGDDLSDAYRTRDRQSPTYGTRGETTARRGTRGGYARYLTHTADRTLAENRNDAQDAYTETVRENNNGYAEYLDKSSATLRNVVNQMRTRNVYDYKDAYAYAITSGLDEETANLAASLVHGMAPQEVSPMQTAARRNMLVQMIKLGLTRDAAFRYAISCGMPENVAIELADACEQVVSNRNNTLY